MRKLAVMLVPAVSSVAAFAAEGDTDVGTQILSGAQTTLTGLLTSAVPVIVAILGAGLAIWGAIALVGLVKRVFSTAKGR